MNGYMIVDAKTGRFGLVEMSYRSFVYFQPQPNGYDVITKPAGLSTAYDQDMVTPDHLLGINYPASFQIRDDLKAIDTRPARKVQFMDRIGSVTGIASGRDLITYTDPANPLSIFGRWDLGRGLTPKPKTVPDGSTDAKVASASMALRAMQLDGVLDLDAGTKSFWMKFGSPLVDGAPFIWSASQWRSQKLRDVPDAIDGDFQELNLHIR